MQNLKQRYPGKALITGASSGIGEQFAYALAKEGFDIILLARREVKLKALQEQLQQQFKVAVQIKVADLSAAQTLPDLLDELVQEDVSLLVSNAGFGIAKGDFVDGDTDAMQRMWQVNSLTPAYLAHSFAAVFKKRSHKTGMIFTGSIEGEAAFPYSAAYAASKAFLHSLVYALAIELRPSGVDVLLLAPGATDTNAPISQGISRDQLVGLMSPEDVATQTLQRLGKTMQFIPGWHNRLFVGLLRLLPVKIAAALSGWGMAQAIKKSNS